MILEALAVWYLGDKIDGMSSEKVSAATEPLKARITELEKTSVTYQSELVSERTKVGDLTSQLRAQNEADMVLAALRVVKKATDGEPRQNVHAAFNAMAVAQQQMAVHNPSLGVTAPYLFGGISPLFGRGF